jgi:AraC-like DNA-binding protein
MIVSCKTEDTDVARYARYDGLPGLEIVTASWRRHAFAPHMHDFYAVSLNDGGCGAFEWGRQQRDATPGTCNLIAPGEIHTGAATRGEVWRYRNLYIDPELMIRLLGGIDWRGPSQVQFASPVASDPVLATRLASVFASIADPHSRLQRETLLLRVVARLASGHLLSGHAPRTVGREHTALARVQAWLDANAEQDVSVRTLAGLADLSPYYLVRAFHRQVGIPPHRYQTVVRCLRARRLLTSGAAISDVAYDTGFCDQSHLNRCFKQVFGTTPGRYTRGQEVR